MKAVTFDVLMASRKNPVSSQPICLVPTAIASCSESPHSAADNLSLSIINFIYY